MSASLDLMPAIQEAHQRIGGLVRHTPVEPSPWLSAATGAEVYVKLENHQLTGSFKIRGALNRILATAAESRENGFVAASTGNHGAAVAHAASLIDAQVTIFVPETADTAKVDRLRRLGVGVEAAGEDCVLAEAAARESSQRSGAVYVSPYNDPQVIAGQGTLGLELTQQLPSLDAAFIALGGGGLLSGSAAALRHSWPEIELIGCSPAASAVMVRSIEAGRLLDLPSEPTLSDGTAGGVEAGSITFDLCRQSVDRFVTVSETEIRSALLDFLGHHHSLIEGAAAVPIAALLASGRRYAGRKVVIVLCGANIAPSLLAELLVDARP